MVRRSRFHPLSLISAPEGIRTGFWGFNISKGTSKRGTFCLNWENNGVCNGVNGKGRGGLVPSVTPRGMRLQGVEK